MEKQITVPMTDTDSLYTFELPPFNQNPLIGIGAQGYSFERFQSFPLLDMIGGPGGENGVPQAWFQALEVGLIAYNPIGAPQDVVGIPIGETALFSEPTFLPEQGTEF